MGGYERDPAPWSLDGVPPDFNNRLLDPDWQRFAPLMAGRDPARARPSRTPTSTQMINGPEAFTPDNEFILGESEVRGFFVAAGFCAHGIAGAGGIGRQMADWILDGEPELDIWKMDIRRFGAAVPQPALTLARTVEVYATYYDIHYPNEERHAGRPLRLSPAYEDAGRAGRGLRREVQVGAAELVHAQRGRRRRVDARGARGAPAARLGGRALVAGHRRRGAGDARARRPSSTSPASPRSRSTGPGALGVPPAALRQRHRPRRSDSITYTQLLNDRGGIECDLTVTRRPTDRFLIVTGTAFGNHDLRLDAAARCPTMARFASGTSPRRWPASGSGARRPATSSPPLTRTTSRTTRFPT